MTWLPFGILSHFFWAIVNVGDKYFLSNKFKNPYVYQLIIVFGAISSVIFIPFANFQVPDPMSLKLLLLSSAFWFTAGFPYIKALQIEDVTRINILWALVPIFSYFMAWFSLGEQLNSSQFIAFAILILATLVASIHIKKKNLKFSKGFWLMVLACLLYAGYAVTMRRITFDVEPINAFIWNGIFLAAYTVIFVALGFFRKSIINELKNNKASTFAIILGIALLGNLGVFLNVIALSLGPVALIFSLEGAQPIMVFILVFAIASFTKVKLKEELDRANIILKTISLLLMLIGISVLYLLPQPL